MKAGIEIAHEYGVAKGKQGKALLLIRDGRTYLPVQLQVEYTAPDGAQIMKVFTRAMPITNNRQTAEKCTYCYFILLDVLQNVISCEK